LLSEMGREDSKRAPTVFVQGGPTLWEDRLPREGRMADPERGEAERRAPNPSPPKRDCQN